MVLKEGKHITLRVAEGLYFPEGMQKGLKCYQIVNNRSGVVEFEEVQLAACWEAFEHFEALIGEVWDEIDGNTAPKLSIVSADEMPPTPTLQ